MNTNKKFRNCIAFSIILLTLLTCFSSSALAEIDGGAVLDALIPTFDSFLESVKDTIPQDSYSISEDSILGKKGNIFIDYDDGEIRMIGKSSYHTYSFKEVDMEFALFIGAIIYMLDNADALKYGISVYFTSNNDTNLLTEKELGELSAQFISAIN